MKYDIIIIGAGAVGGAVARRLSRYNLSVLALEKEQDVSCGISKANTGIIHSPAFITPGTLKAEMTVNGAAAFDELSGQLGFGYQKPGALLLAYSDDDIPILRNYIDNGKRNYSAAGLSIPNYAIIGADELRTYEPEINESVSAALFLPDAGRIIPYEYTIALWENAVNNGVELRLGSEANGLARAEHGEAWTVSCRDGSEYRAEFVINAAGHGSDSLGISVGLGSSGIQRVKGQYLILERNTGPEVNHILFQVPGKETRKKGKGILVTRTVYGNIMIGPDATWQDDDYDTSTDIRALEQVLDGARASIPGIDISKTIKTFAGVRPKPAGGDFIIAEDRGFIHLCGIESPGLTSSPAIAVRVEEMLRKMGVVLKQDPSYNPIRRPIVEDINDFPPDEVNRRVKLLPGDEQRLVCRCEQVPETRISDALNRCIPVTTMDGVKRRTRAGQGRCQGAFCGPRVRKMLAEHCGIPEDEITLRGTEPEPERITAADIKAFLRGN